jgi:outer membrane protein assembly factor BamB
MWDDTARRIYVATVDNQFHALDAHGRRRWSFRAGGKAVTRPALVDGVIIVGCDNQQVYALEATSGTSKWTFGAAATATSAMASETEAFLIGSADGFVHALEPQSGLKRWSYHGNAPIQAPILGAKGLTYFVKSDGEAVALDFATGDTRWVTKLDGATKTALAVGFDQVFVVEGGKLSALDLATGKLLWKSDAVGYAGTPAVLDHSLLIAREDGIVRRIGFNGAIVEEWTATPSGADQGKVQFPQGLTEGQGAFWLPDSEGTIWRLGPGN